MKTRSSRHDASLLDPLRLSLIAACILLVGCGPTFDELGFESEEEAQHLIEMGYPTFNALLTRGRFTSAEQAREAVEAGFYELSTYENSLYAEYRKGGYSLDEVLELQAEFTNKELSEALILEAMGTIAASNIAKFDPSVGHMVSGTASIGECDAMNRALESLSEQTKAAFSMTVEITCRNVPTLAEVRESLTSPDWQPTDKMPKEWGRMHRTGAVAKEKGGCFFEGPEATVMFTYTDPEKGLEYLFSNFPPPPNVTWDTRRTVTVTEKKKVWVSSKNPNLFLSLEGNRSFSIDLIEDGFTAGKHKTLDGEPWDINVNLMTEYNAADYRRWAVDTNNQEPYQRAPNQMCPPASYANWLDVRFEVKGARSGTATLRQIMR